jgi:hypothetical protein
MVSKAPHRANALVQGLNTPAKQTGCVAANAQVGDERAVASSRERARQQRGKPPRCCREQFPWAGETFNEGAHTQCGSSDRERHVVTRRASVARDCGGARMPLALGPTFPTSHFHGLLKRQEKVVLG